MNIATVRVVPGVIVPVAVLLAAGCGGGRKEHAFSAADAERIADVGPALAGWVWPANDAKPAWDASSREASKRWEDGAKLANLDVGVYPSSREAHAAMRSFDAFSRSWGRRAGHIIRDRSIHGPGADAWVLWVRGTGSR